jgi:glycine C-acetyltransferase
VFSMDGDILDLPVISAVCRQHGASLMVDECHSVGVLGRTGSGIEEHFGMSADTIDIKMGTLSKAIPSAGGYVAGTSELCTFLRHEARGFIYSGAPSAANVAAALEGLTILQNSPHLVAELHLKSQFFKALLLRTGFDLGTTQTPIVPIIVGSTENASNLAKYCQENGIFIHAIYPPVVPAGTARLRATVIASHTEEELTQAAAVLERGAATLGAMKR